MAPLWNHYCPSHDASRLPRPFLGGVGSTFMVSEYQHRNWHIGCGVDRHDFLLCLSDATSGSARLSVSHTPHIGVGSCSTRRSISPISRVLLNLLPSWRSPKQETTLQPPDWVEESAEQRLCISDITSELVRRAISKTRYMSFRNGGIVPR